jgi:hypothetical protein
MRSDDLIAQLASRAVPVQPLPSPRLRLMAWSALALACGAVGVAAFGPRFNLEAVAGDPAFLLLGAIAAGVGAVAAGASLVLAVPGAERSPSLRVATVALFGVWAIALVALIVRGGQGFAAASHWYTCFARVGLIGLLPAVTLFVMLRRAAPLQLGWTSALAAIGAMGIGALAIHFICPLTDAAHALLGHLGPVLTIGWLGGWTVKSLLK